MRRPNPQDTRQKFAATSDEILPSLHHPTPWRAERSIRVFPPSGAPHSATALTIQCLKLSLFGCSARADQLGGCLKRTREPLNPVPAPDASEILRCFPL